MPLMAMNARQLRASQFLGAYRGLIGQEARGSARLLHINALLRNGNRSGPGENGLSSTRDIGHESEEEEKQRRHGVLTQLRDVVKQKRQTLEPRLKKQLDELGRRWNSYSGYEEVTEAKALVLEAEVQLKELREQQAIERKAYVSAVTRRADSQRNLNELLSRKSTWNEQDLSRYTELLRSEHGDSQHEKETTERFERMGDRVNAAWDDVVRKTLDRYHKEQIWSDRVRATSTYASYAIAGLNVLIFLLAFVVVEPYKRRKLAETFESRLLQGEEINAQMLASVIDDFREHVESLESYDSDTNKLIHLLALKSGIEVDDNGIISDVEAKAQVDAFNRNKESLGQKRRDMAMAGALGFAIGAGLLSAFGALHS